MSIYTATTENTFTDEEEEGYGVTEDNAWIYAEHACVETEDLQLADDISLYVDNEDEDSLQPVYPVAGEFRRREREREKKKACDGG